MSGWKQHKEAALADLASAESGYPDEVLTHLHNAVGNITKAIESIESEEDDEDSDDE